MRLNEASMEIRPRSAWEALDLGCLLARRHVGLLMLSWAALTLPLFAVLSILTWQYPTLSLLLFWWLKPLYERLPLFILSHALFGDTPTLGRSFRALPGVLRPQWLASVTWRRFSPTRSFDLPVLQLEGLSGAARRERLIVLGRRNSSAATWLTIVGMHLEGALSLGLLALLYFVIPAQLLTELSWHELLGLGGEALWLEHLTNLLYALVLVVWEPIYVASGFSLYLNRRTILEGWDIELAFRRLRTRLMPMLVPLLLGFGLLFAQPPAALLAAEAKQATAEARPEAQRLLNQSLTSQAASQRISDILDQPPFRHSETVTRWRFGDEASDNEPGWFARMLERLLQAEGLQRSLDALMTVIEVLLWAALFTGVAVVLWRHREWLQLYAGRFGRPLRKPQAPPEILFGLSVTPDSLPADVAGEVERLWSTEPRQALGLLYRALLSRLLHERQLPLRNAHTESEALQLIAALEQPALTQFASALTHHWQNLAYGHRAPPDTARSELCSAWRELFAVEPAA
ncbi:DUF4129 domain-containing protein [Stutzerimonas nitrititolerans]|uniref:DUF4129 domain-containing protein n=1 Tax=Stutzerimonas nitrititolerans TaxID=2482751 RepID=UPI0028AFF39C|nr:DUF4129 domain-containing protein [Stutzerimonas nitrititolerans]